MIAIVIADLVSELERQVKLKKEGKFHWTCADTYYCGEPIFDSEKLAVLAEEFGEVAQLIAEAVISKDRRNPRELKKELIQVAAVAVAWCEAIDRELGK